MSYRVTNNSVVDPHLHIKVGGGGGGHADPDTWLGIFVLCNFSYIEIVDILFIVEDPK